MGKKKDRSREPRTDARDGPPSVRQRPATSLTRRSGARCATNTAGQIGMPAGIDATIAGVAKGDSSGSGIVATTGASRMTRSAAPVRTTVIVTPGATAMPAASATKVPVVKGLRWRLTIMPSIASVSCCRAAMNARSCASRICNRSPNAADGSIVGRFRARSNERRIRVSSAAHCGQSRRCRSIPSMSTPLNVSSTYASCLRRNSRQFMRREEWGEMPWDDAPSIPAGPGAVPGIPPCAYEKGAPTRGSPSPHPITPFSVHPWLDDLGEGITRAVQARLHRAEVAVRDLGDLLVRLPLELAKDEHFPMVRRQLRHRLRHEFAQVPFPVEVVRTGRRILELQRPVLVLPIALHRLEQHERITRPVAQFVLGQVRRDRVRPGRELLRTVESMQMPVHSDEHFLHQIFGLLSVTDRAIDEIEQPRLVAL